MNIKKYLRGGADHYDFHTIALWIYGILNNLTPWDKFPSKEKKKVRLNYLKRVSFIYLSKQPVNRGIFLEEEIFNLAELTIKCEKQLNRQVKLYAPEIVICSGVKYRKYYSVILGVSNPTWGKTSTGVLYLWSDKLCESKDSVSLILVVPDKVYMETQQESYEKLIGAIGVIFYLYFQIGKEIVREGHTLKKAPKVFNLDILNEFKPK